MTSNNDNDTTLKGHSSDQGGRDNRDVGGKQKNIPEIDGAAALAKEGGGARRRRHSDNSEKKPKRHRCNNPHPRCIIPEARVIQANNECAYISEHEEDEREYLPMAIRRSGVVVRYSLRQEIRHQVDVKNNDSSAFSKFNVGGRQRSNPRCHCFNCWQLAVGSS